MKLTRSIICTLMMLSLSSLGTLCAQTDGNVVFSVLTVSNGAAYSPSHVLAIWVKDELGNFVISRKVMANNQKRHLVKWVENSGQNSVNAITGATLPNHVMHTVSWDCRDLNGNLIPDGNYEIWIEYTSRNSANGGDSGPSTKVLFNKGTEVVNLAPADENYFRNITLNYSPLNVHVDNSLPAVLNFKTFPVPFNKMLNIELTLTDPEYIHIAVYNQKGQRVKEIVNANLPSGLNILKWDGTNSGNALVPSGIYILRITYLGKLYSQRVVWMN